jgi:uncharacterized DUF497 family protein
MINFEWDPAKAEANVRKHGVTFEEAKTIFRDPFSLEIKDDANSIRDEARFITIGRSVEGRILLVGNCDRGDNIRIYSARCATPREQRTYEEHEE